MAVLAALSRLIRVIVGISLLVAASVFSDVQLKKPTHEIFRKLAGIEELVPNDTTAFMRRVKELRPFLPNEQKVGFITDDTHSIEKLLLARHALAPIILDGSILHPFVIGIFRDRAAGLEAAQRLNLRLMRDFGHGLVLLRGAER